MSWTVDGRTLNKRHKCTFPSTALSLSGSVATTVELSIGPAGDSAAHADFWADQDGGAGKFGRFADAAGTTVYQFEVEHYDTTASAELGIWHVERTIATSNTDVYYYYKDAGTPTAPTGYSTDDAWGTAFKLVHHYNTDHPDLTIYQDSTVNANHGTGNGTPSPPDAAGEVGRCISLDGVDQYVSIADAASIQFSPSDAFTVLMRVNMTDASSFPLLGKGETGVGNIENVFTVTGSDIAYVKLNDDDTTGDIQINADAAITSLEGSWIEIGYSYDGGTAGTGLTMMIDGAVRATTTYDSPTFTGMADTAFAWIMGKLSTAATYATGSVDKLVIISGEQNLDWFKVHNKARESGAWTLGDQEPAIHLIDMKVLAGNVQTNLSDYRAIVALDATALLDLLAVPALSSTTLVDSKVIVESEGVNLNDLKVAAALSFAGTMFVDGKVAIANSAINQLDAKIQIGDIATSLLDFTVSAAQSGTFLVDLKSIISTRDDVPIDIKLTVGNTNLIVINRHVGGFAAGASVQYRLWDTDTKSILTDWTTIGVSEVERVGGISDYMVGIVHTTGETQLLLQWNEVGTNKGASEAINLQDLFAIESIKHLEGKIVLDEASGIQYKFERDGVTVYKKGQVYEDSAGVTKYQAGSTEINRRERLESP